MTKLSERLRNVVHRVFACNEAADLLDECEQALKKRDDEKHDYLCQVGQGGYCNCGHKEVMDVLAKLRGEN